MPTNVQTAVDFSQIVKKSLKKNMTALHFPCFRSRLRYIDVISLEHIFWISWKVSEWTFSRKGRLFICNLLKYYLAFLGDFFFKKHCVKSVPNSKFFWSAFSHIRTTCSSLRKSIRSWSYSGPHFLASGLDTKRYSVSLRIQCECDKMRTRITPVFPIWCVRSHARTPAHAPLVWYV